MPSRWIVRLMPYLSTCVRRFHGRGRANAEMLLFRVSSLKGTWKEFEEAAVNSVRKESIPLSRELSVKGSLRELWVCDGKLQREWSEAYAASYMEYGSRQYTCDAAESESSFMSLPYLRLMLTKWPLLVLEPRLEYTRGKNDA